MNLLRGLCAALWPFAVSAAASTLLAGTPPSFAEDGAGSAYEGQIEPHEGENFAFAQYKLWLPAVPRETTGILCIVLHPHGENGVRFDDPSPWVEMAMRHHCALLSVSFVKHDDDYVPWCRAAAGSGRALLQAIDESADEGGLPDLKKAPLVVAGICEAGQFAYEFTAFAPQRVRAFFTMGGARHNLDVAEQAAGTSGLLIAPTDRSDEVTVRNLATLFAQGQKYAAPWAFSAEPIGRYDAGRGSELGTTFLETSLEQLESRARGDGAPPASVAALPVGKIGPPAEAYPAKTAGQLRAVFASDAVCRFVDGRVAEKWSKPEVIEQKDRLSFVSVPLPGVAAVYPAAANLGVAAMDGNAMPEVAAAFTVQTDPEAHVDEVRVVSEQSGAHFHVVPGEGGRWAVECRFETQGYPCGSYRCEVPIRCYRGGRAVGGGLCAQVTGQIRGDIRVEPRSIDFDAPAAADGRQTVRFKSVSGVPVELLGVDPSTPEWIQAEAEDQNGIRLRLKCTVRQGADGLNQTLSGYLVVRVKAQDEERIKVLCFRKANSADPTR